MLFERFEIFFYFFFLFKQSFFSLKIMDNINNYSRQRGRVIEFRELLYGYHRVNTLHGQDLILDLLLIYKKYRGKKMTVPVRRHLYIQRSFTEIQIREITDENNIQTPKQSTKLDTVKKMWNSGLEKLSDTFAIRGEKTSGEISSGGKSKIVFVLPISGRFETFLRFLNNYEEVCTLFTCIFIFYVCVFVCFAIAIMSVLVKSIALKMYFLWVSKIYFAVLTTLINNITFLLWDL